MEIKLKENETKILLNLVEMYGNEDSKLSLRRCVESLVDRIVIRNRREILNLIEQHGMKDKKYKSHEYKNRMVR